MKRILSSLILCVALLLALLTPAQAITVFIKSGLATNVTPVPFLLVLATDGNTPITLKTSATITVTVYKPGGAGFVAAAGTITEKGVGVYEYLPSAAETAANGLLYIHIADATDAAQAQDYSGQVVGFDPNTDLGAATLATVNTATAGTNTRVILSLPAVAAGAAGGLVKLDAAARNSVNLLSYTTQAAGGGAGVLINGDGTTTSQLLSAFAFPAGTVSTYAGDPWATLLTAETTAGSFGTLLKTYTAPPALPAFPTNFANLIISGGNVGVNLSQPLTGAGFTTISIEKALEAAWAQGAGTWTLNTAGTTLTLYAPDGVTIFRQFNVSATGRQ